MQLYAFDEHDQIVSAPRADRHRNYICLECRGVVRLRGGVHRQKHFFHLTMTEDCSQRRKGMVHIQVQCAIERLLPSGDCFLERRFHEINRIADVVWESEKIVFEVQCSGMTGEEAQGRNQDYRSIGYQVVWILHDSRYNRWRVSALEEALADTPHYYTNIDGEGNGEVYDQWRWTAGGIRRARHWPLLVDLQMPIRSKEEEECPLRLVKERKRSWPLHFRGDLLDAAKRQRAEQRFADYLMKAMDKESSLLVKKQEIAVFVKAWYFLLRAYKIFFNFILERSCH